VAAIRIGLIGCGAVADFGHLPAIVSNPDFQLVALSDPNRERLVDVSGRFGSPATYSDPEAFFEHPMDAVAVTSPSFAHRPNVLAAARQGLHVLCEKPIAMNDLEADEMIAAMTKAGKQFFIAFCYRFSPVALQIRDWVRQGIVGEVRSLRLVYDWNLHGQFEQASDGTWIESPRWRGRMDEGGPMVDCGVHQIDLARWWLGQDVVDTTVAAAWVADYEAPDHVWLHLEHEGGAHTTVEMSFTFGHTAREPISIFQYHLIGTGGVIRYEREGWILEARTGEQTIRVPGASEKSFEGMYQALGNALLTGDCSLMPTASDGLIATRIARGATEEAIERRAALIRPSS
jgi:predicted dehydrogenase